MRRMESLYHFLEASKKIFEINEVVTEDSRLSEVIVCAIVDISQQEHIKLDYDIYLICNKAEEEYAGILARRGV